MLTDEIDMIVNNETRRRRVPRRALKRKVGVLIKGQYSIAHCWEIGEGGILIEIPQELALNQLLIVTFCLPNETHTVVKGILRYRQPHTQKFGIEFLNLNFQMKRAIRTFVASKILNAASFY